jgi:hypothetical protein
VDLTSETVWCRLTTLHPPHERPVKAVHLYFQACVDSCLDFLLWNVDLMVADSHPAP